MVFSAMEFGKRDVTAGVVQGRASAENGILRRSFRHPTITLLILAWKLSCIDPRLNFTIEAIHSRSPYWQSNSEAGLMVCVKYS